MYLVSAYSSMVNTAVYQANLNMFQSEQRAVRLNGCVYVWVCVWCSATCGSVALSPVPVKSKLCAFSVAPMHRSHDSPVPPPYPDPPQAYSRVTLTSTLLALVATDSTTADQFASAARAASDALVHTEFSLYQVPHGGGVSDLDASSTLVCALPTPCLWPPCVCLVECCRSPCVCAAVPVLASFSLSGYPRMMW